MPGIIDEKRFGYITWEGATSAETYLFYAGLAALLRPARILEIGTFDGVSTAALYSGAKVFGHQPQMFCVDLSIRKEKIRNNFRAMGVGGPDLAENFIWCEGDSRKILPEIAKFGMKFDLILIDGCHDKRFVREDWKNAQSLLAPRGVVIFHDITLFPWIGRIIDEIEAQIDQPYVGDEKCPPRWDVWRWRGSDYPPGHRMFGEKAYLRDRGNEGFAMVRRHESFETPTEDSNDWQGLRKYMQPLMAWEKGWGYDQTHVIPNIDPDKPSEEVEFSSTPKKLKLIAGEVAAPAKENDFPKTWNAEAEGRLVFELMMSDKDREREKVSHTDWKRLTLAQQANYSARGHRFRQDMLGKDHPVFAGEGEGG